MDLLYKLIKKSKNALINGIVYCCCLPIRIGGRLSIQCGNTNFMDNLIKEVCKIYEKNKNVFVVYKARPKTAAQITSIEKECPIHLQTGIIIQGPLVLKDHFTLESVKSYHLLYPGVTVIVSTWKDQDERELEAIKKCAGTVVVLSDKPSKAGFLNINLQCKSTMAGIQKAEQMNLSYILKTRSDWRFYGKGVITYFYNLLHEFPVGEGNIKQEKRIITSDIGTDETAVLFYPYWLADFYTFSTLNDAKKYWDVEFSPNADGSKRFVVEKIRSEQWTWKKRVEENLLAEAYIVRNYIKRMEGSEPEVLLEKSWEYIKRYFMIVPRSEVEGYWFKYDFRRFNEGYDWGTYYENDSKDKCLTYNFNFVHWFNLYSGTLEFEKEFENFSSNNYYHY